jgi:ribonuclease P protein subunit RPR2
MNPALRQIALERIHILVSNAISIAKSNPDLSERHAFLAKRISMRYKIGLPYEIQIVFCKRCKSFIAPGINSKIRLGRSPVKAIRITCNFCGHTYRKIIPKE